MGTEAMAFGTSRTPGLSGVGLNAGFRTPYGILLPPALKVVYVRNTSSQDQEPYDVSARIVPTLAQALTECRAGLGDMIVVLPGHSESVTDATMLANLQNGTRIVGVGQGSSMPTFRWTNTAAQWAIAANDVSITGLRLRLEGANGVVKAIAVTGDDVAIQGCDIETSSGAANLATIAIEVSTGNVGGGRFNFSGNRMRGVAAGVCTNGILISGANAKNIEITDNNLQFASNSTNGLINVAAAALDGVIAQNYLSNITASSVAALVFGAAASSGIAADNRIRVQSTGAQTPGTTGITTGATTLYSFHQNYITNDPRVNGVVISPAADT